VAGAGAWLPSALTLTALATVIWVAQFLYASGFALYQDDYARIPFMIGADAREFAAQLWQGLTHPPAGLPLHEPVIYTYALLGAQLGPLWGVYVVAFLVDLATAWVFYLIARRLLGQEMVALAAALAFVLFPADATRTWLTSAYRCRRRCSFC
jgi:hypothetical protein